MKCRLDLIVRCDEFVDNARPKWLENPSTEAPLEYDRFYYLLKIAFEFNGSQHYGVTEVFNDEEVVNEGMKRDSVKEELSRQHGIKLVVVTPDDLIPGGWSSFCRPNCRGFLWWRRAHSLPLWRGYALLTAPGPPVPNHCCFVESR